LHLLPVADIVLYVGSQEKYHDQLGWDLFLQQRKRRAFAFVLNKWDRCVRSGESGLRPDEDLLHDLTAEGFQNPLIFRTCAQKWVDLARRNAPPSSVPPPLVPVAVAVPVDVPVASVAVTVPAPAAVPQPPPPQLPPTS